MYFGFSLYTKHNLAPKTLLIERIEYAKAGSLLKFVLGQPPIAWKNAIVYAERKLELWNIFNDFEFIEFAPLAIAIGVRILIKAGSLLQN